MSLFLQTVASYAAEALGPDMESLLAKCERDYSRSLPPSLEDLNDKETSSNRRERLAHARLSSALEEALDGKSVPWQCHRASQIFLANRELANKPKFAASVVSHVSGILSTRIPLWNEVERIMAPLAIRENLADFSAFLAVKEYSRGPQQAFILPLMKLRNEILVQLKASCPASMLKTNTLFWQLDHQQLERFVQAPHLARLGNISLWLNSELENQNSDLVYHASTVAYDPVPTSLYTAGLLKVPKVPDQLALALAPDISLHAVVDALYDGFAKTGTKGRVCAPMPKSTDLDLVARDQFVAGLLPFLLAKVQTFLPEFAADGFSKPFAEYLADPKNAAAYKAAVDVLTNEQNLRDQLGEQKKRSLDALHTFYLDSFTQLFTDQ